jgi:hypothetical protein
VFLCKMPKFMRKNILLTIPSLSHFIVKEHNKLFSVLKYLRWNHFFFLFDRLSNYIH